MSTNILALLIAVTVVIFFIVGLGGLSLLSGVISQFFERPKLKFLRPQNHHNFAFSFDWPFDKDQSQIDFIKLSLFNPFGNPTRSELVRSFKPMKEAFAQEIEMGQSFVNFMGANGFNKSEVSIEVGSSKDGINYHFSFSGARFLELLNQASKTAQEEQNDLSKDRASESAYEVPVKSFVAEQMPPEEGVQIVLPNNPAFQSLFAGSSGGGSSSSAAAENFKVAKVWIEPGCIVCNACEGIYPEVFEVKADTCIVRPTAPLDNGLRIQEAAEGCPVEVIKFAKA